MKMSISINENSDWKNLAAQGLRTVVDPLVFRCGELFLRGAQQVSSPNAVWELLNVNLHSIGMFFDALILNEKLPVFNYGDTFDMELNFDERMLTLINRKATTALNKLEENEQVLFDVDVGWNAYHEVKSAALTELEKIFNGEQKIPAETFGQVFMELSAAEYKWSPGLMELENKLKNHEEKMLADYILGGLIFGGYAQQMESEHLLQPKRSRIFLALSMQSPSAGYEIEKHLFEDLKNRTNSNVEDLPWLPTFFPYLLSKADTPEEILKEVVKLRNSSEVKDYRQWFDEVMNDWKNNGKISVEKRNDVKAIAKSVEYGLGNISRMPQVELKAKIAEVGMGMPIPGEVNFTPAIKGLWGWFLNSLPGKRYRKLLTRAIIADHEYVKIENRIRTVWKAA